MDDNMSIGRVVSTIMESLSEGISQLMQFVISKQQSNAPMPANIPLAAEGVTTASNTLADVATGVAEEEYGDYPEIQTPILGAAADVRVSARAVSDAVANLKSSADKQAGWTRLLDACSVISEQTIYILQLVYSAELKRIIQLGEAAKDLAGTSQAALAPKDAQQFVDNMAAMAGMADGLSEMLQERVRDEESPLRQEETKKAIELMKAYSDDLPRLANVVLKDPSNNSAKVAHDKKIKEFVKDVEEAIAPARTNLALLPEKPHKTTTPAASSTPSPANFIDNIVPLIENYLASMPPDDEPERVAKIIEAGQGLAELIERVTAPTQDAKDHARDIKELPKKMEEFKKLVEPFIELIDDEEVKALLADALGDLSALVAEMVTTSGEVAKHPRDPAPRKKLEALGQAAIPNVKFIIKKVNRTPAEKQEEAKRRFPKVVKQLLDAINNDAGKIPWGIDQLKKVIRDMNPPNSDGSTPPYLAGRNIAAAIEALEKELAMKGKRNDPDSPNKRTFPEAKAFFEKLLKDEPPTPPPADVAVKAQNVEALLDRLEAVLKSPNSDPKKLANTVKAIGVKMAPLIQAARKAAEEIKDPVKKKEALEAVDKLEKEFPLLVEDVKEVMKNPTPENKDKALERLNNLRPPLATIQQAITPDAPGYAGKRAKQELAKLANAAKNNDPKGAEQSMKQVKDLLAKFAQAAKERAAQAPPNLKEHMERKAKEVEDKVQALEPIVLTFAKKPNPESREAVIEATKGLVGPIDALLEDLQFAPQAIQAAEEKLVREILASIKATNIKKMDPSNLLKLSRQLASLIRDMVSKTSNELHNQSGLSERAKAALELERLLSNFEKDAGGNKSYNSAESINLLMNKLNISVSGQPDGSSSGGVQTHLSQQMSSAAKEIRMRTDGSVEGTQLHSISKALAADLQKFAEADSGKSRSDLIVLGRTISANIVQLADELKRLAGACRDPKMQEKLLLNARVLRNYATQLKIMASVRAASPNNTGRDSSSDQLGILAFNLGALIGDASNAVSTMKQNKTISASVL